MMPLLSLRRDEGTGVRGQLPVNTVRWLRCCWHLRGELVNRLVG